MSNEAIEQLAINCRELRAKIRELEQESSQLDRQGTLLGDLSRKFAGERDQAQERVKVLEAEVEFWKTQAQEAGERRVIAERKLVALKARKAKR